MKNTPDYCPGAEFSIMPLIFRYSPNVLTKHEDSKLAFA